MRKLLFALLSFSSIALSSDSQEIQCRITPLHLVEKHMHVHREKEWHHPRPNRLIQPGFSANWSGFITRLKEDHSRMHSVNKVSGFWAVPTISPAFLRTFSFVWVGMDGYSNHRLEQIGTGHKWGNGVQRNIAFFQMEEDELYEIEDFPLNIGDQIRGEVQYLGGGFFELSLENLTQGKKFTVPREYSFAPDAHRSSANWIVEVPFSHGAPQPLSNFTTITFTNGIAKIRGVPGAIGFDHWENTALTMTAPTLTTTVKSRPSALTSGGSSFTLTWVSQ